MNCCLTIGNKKNYLQQGGDTGSYIGTWSLGKIFNKLRPRQNGHNLPDNIFKYIFFNENVKIAIKIALQFVPKGTINNIPALV